MKLTKESVFIYPTDTVWGIGASIHSEEARKKISHIKGNPEDKPLSIMFTDVALLHKSFNLPDAMNIAWLRQFFKLESTLAVPLKISKIPIPSWVTGKSPLVSLRCLEHEELKDIGSQLKAPFFTTSLNLTGHPPIVTFEEARAFHKDHAPDVEFIAGSGHDLSGRSSTIVFFHGSHFEIARVGARVDEIKKQLELTGFKIS